MDAELKAKWIEALRSGKYPQGKSVMISGAGTFCCLGVLAIVAGATVEPISTYEDEETGNLIQDEDYHSITLAESTCDGELFNKEQLKALGLTCHVQAALSEMNDGSPEFAPNLSFAEIADFIEKNAMVDAP